MNAILKPELLVIELSRREQFLLELLEKMANGNYPLEFTLTDLTERFFAASGLAQTPDRRPRNIVRSALATLGLKLAAASVGSIVRISPLGTMQHGAYRLSQYVPWMVNTHGRIMPTDAQESTQCENGT